MKLYEAFFLSFILSLVAGAVIFLGIPALFSFDMKGGSFMFLDSELMLVALVLYGIYVFIQFLLSVINLIQVISFESRGQLNFENGTVSNNLFFAEMALYALVFTALAIAFETVTAVPFILLFSIPYIICCTNSVLIFRYFLKKIAIEKTKDTALNAGEIV